MDFQAIVGTVASIVTIVGGVFGFISALSKNPIFTRFWQRQSRIRSQPVVKPSPSLPTPIGRVTSSPHTENQSRQRLVPSQLRPGIVYGLVTGVLASLILLGGAVRYAQTGQFGSNTFQILAFIGMGVLCIIAGVLSSRASGSLNSAVIAGGILGIVIILMLIIPFFLLTPPPYEGWTFDIVSGIVITYGAIGVVFFFVSVLFGLLGCYLYKRLQVPAPNKYTNATIKPPSGIDAQLVQQAPYPALEVPVQEKCQNCGTSNSPRAKFCNRCGVKLYY